MIRRGGYGNKIGYRLGGLPPVAQKRERKKRIWLQAVSVGEISSVTRLVNDLLAEENTKSFFREQPARALKWQMTSLEGRYWPMGLFLSIGFLFSQRAWRRIDPDMIIMVDSELWPEHFQQA